MTTDTVFGRQHTDTVFRSSKEGCSCMFGHDYNDFSTGSCCTSKGRGNSSGHLAPVAWSSGIMIHCDVGVADTHAYLCLTVFMTSDLVLFCFVLFCQLFACCFGRYEAYGWHTQTVSDGTDCAAILAAVEKAKAQTGKPSIIKTKTIIGYGSTKQACLIEIRGEICAAIILREFFCPKFCNRS